jgi:hypothetical protein
MNRATLSVAASTELLIIQARRLYTSDTLALSYILNNSTDYQKPDSIRHGLADILGEGMRLSLFHIRGS